MKNNLTETVKANNFSAKDEQSIANILDAARNNKLIVVVGAGVSMALTNGKAPSWKKLISHGLTHAVIKGRMQETQSRTWMELLESSDIDDLLSCAEIVGRKLGAPKDVLYERWLQEHFKDIKVENQKLADAFRKISALDIPICTLNYDHLLEDVTSCPTILMSELNKTAAWVRQEQQGILHLHGYYDVPDSCILGIRDYENTLSNDVRDLLQRDLAAFRQLLFIGCGDTLADPNFSSLITWMRKHLKGASLIHYALTLESELNLRHQDEAWSGFVEPISYGSNHDDLAHFLTRIFSESEGKKPVRKKKSTIGSEAVIDKYRSFLIRDCGQMTIEGVSADLDTGQRKFDLERLFVPLKVMPCPPEFSPSDPEGPAKLEKWLAANSDSKAIGETIEKNKRIALLALPGGGKTLLLKRLAVAYADPARRVSSADQLPDLNLLPVMIRCREWREQITSPIPTLFKRIEDVTGQSDLAGFSNALVPHLKSGKVLLLIDGLDEIHKDGDRSIFVDNLESFIEQYPKICVVVTSREAGFNLVAPSISRFCTRWRLAPLEPNAITSLCEHWHRLMVGESREAALESAEVSKTLLSRPSLRRLAENPLLLTMLLVVKHGAGNLPPDRVSLYGRAVDVLLDTWNIKGHEPLSPKEAVPQLSYIAFQLLSSGKQTATEKELLVLLKEAREKHSSINRYAKDTPYEFLKRVELRSSLLVQAGFQIEHGQMVPFYQFRHLTFQEYLCAVAAAEGHYQKYQQQDSVLTALEENLLVDEWKEVIPMAAVLAKKHAEPLWVKLIDQGNYIKALVEGRQSELIPQNEYGSGIRFFSNSVVALLRQCLVEEAEASNQSIASSLNLIAFFARGCVDDLDIWTALCRGPYAEELFNQAWLLYKDMNCPREAWMMNTCASLLVHQRPVEYWHSTEGKQYLNSLLNDSTREKKARGLLSCMGIFWNALIANKKITQLSIIPIQLIESFIFDTDSALWGPATWIWINVHFRQASEVNVSTAILDLLLKRFLSLEKMNEYVIVVNALRSQFGLPRDYWTPILTSEQILKLRQMAFDSENLSYDDSLEYIAMFVVGYHSRTIWSDEELFLLLNRIDFDRHLGSTDSERSKVDIVITEIGGNASEFWANHLSDINIQEAFKEE